MNSKSQQISHYILTVVFLMLALGIVNTSLSDKYAVPSIHRAIQVPVYYWGVLISYLFISNIAIGRRVNLRAFVIESITIGVPLHLYFLLGNLLLQLSEGAILSRIFLYYIWGAAFFSSIVLVFIGLYSEDKEYSIHSSSFYGRIPFLVSPVALAIYLFYQAKYPEFLVILFGLAAGMIMAKRVRVSTLGKFFKKINENEKLLVLIIFLLAFFTRYASSVNIILKTGYDSSGGFISASDDGFKYESVAKTFMNDPFSLFRGDVKLWDHYDEGYGVFIGLIYLLFGRNFFAATFFQAILGALIPLLSFYIGKRIVSKRMGIIAGLITAFNEPLIWLSGVYGHEALWCPILFIFSFLLVEINCERGEGINWKLIFLSGMSLGILALVRSLYFYFLVPVALWFLIFRNSKPLKRLIEGVVILFIAALIIFMTFKITKNSFGGNKGKAALNWSATYARLYPPFTNIGNDRLIALRINPFENPTGSLDAIIQNPVKFVKTSIEIFPLRVIAYLETYQFGYFDPIYMVNPAKITARFPLNLEFYSTILFIFGLIAVFRNKQLLYSPLFLPLVFNIFCYAIVFGPQSPRLREVSIPYIYMIGAIGINNLLSFIGWKMKETRHPANSQDTDLRKSVSESF